MWNLCLLITKPSYFHVILDLSNTKKEESNGFWGDSVTTIM